MMNINLNLPPNEALSINISISDAKNKNKDGKAKNSAIAYDPFASELRMDIKDVINNSSLSLSETRKRIADILQRNTNRPNPEEMNEFYFLNRLNEKIAKNSK